MSMGSEGIGPTMGWDRWDPGKRTYPACLAARGGVLLETSLRLHQVDQRRRIQLEGEEDLRGRRGWLGLLSPGNSRNARRRPHQESTGAGGEGKGGSDRDYNKAVKLSVPWEGRTSWLRAPSQAPRRLECRRERWWAGLLGERAPRLRRSESGREGGVKGGKVTLMEAVLWICSHNIIEKGGRD